MAICLPYRRLLNRAVGGRLRAMRVAAKLIGEMAMQVFYLVLGLSIAAILMAGLIGLLILLTYALGWPSPQPKY